MGLQSGLLTTQVFGELQRGLNMAELGLKKERLTQLTLLLMSMTSREMARSMPSTSAISSELATLTPPWRPSLRSAVRPRRERRSFPRLSATPPTRLPRTPRTRMASFHSSHSWKKCALLRSKLQISYIQSRILHCHLSKKCGFSILTDRALHFTLHAIPSKKEN